MACCMMMTMILMGWLAVKKWFLRSTVTVGKAQSWRLSTMSGTVK